MPQLSNIISFIIGLGLLAFGAFYDTDIVYTKGVKQDDEYHEEFSFNFSARVVKPIVFSLGLLLVLWALS